MSECTSRDAPITGTQLGTMGSVLKSDHVEDIHGASEREFVEATKNLRVRIRDPFGSGLSSEFGPAHLVNVLPDRG